MLKQLLIFWLKIHKKCWSPFLPPACRFYPTCSQYALEAVDKYGGLKGGFLGLKRLLRCHPFAAGGADPVP